MPQPDGPSLVDFAEALKPKPACRVCDLPEMKEIHEARHQGVSYETIARWLVEVRGYPAGHVSDHRLQRHFSDKHHV